MNCIKCGREIKKKQVFCEDCLAVMDRYPVKPGTPIQLPTRPKKAPTPHKVRLSPKPEDQIYRLKSSVRWLSLGLVVVLLGFIAAVTMMLWLLDKPGFLG